MSEAVRLYYAALERLKQNKPTNVEKGTAVNKDTVALEAGKKRGSIRKRPGFEQLIKDIELAGQSGRKRRTNKGAAERVLEMTETLAALEAENDMLKARYMSLLYLNYEMANQMRKHNLDVPKFGQVIDLAIDSILPIE